MPYHGVNNPILNLNNQINFPIIFTYMASSESVVGTVVARDGTGSFSAHNITSDNFIGSGSGLTNIPNSATSASLSSTPYTIALRDSVGNISANSFVGSGSTLTNIQNSSTSADTNNTPNAIVSRNSNGDISVSSISASSYTLSNTIDFAGSTFSIDAIPVTILTLTTTINTGYYVRLCGIACNVTTGSDVVAYNFIVSVKNVDGIITISDLNDVVAIKDPIMTTLSIDFSSVGNDVHVRGVGIDANVINWAAKCTAVYQPLS